jgi:hypothetical protein
MSYLPIWMSGKQNKKQIIFNVSVESKNSTKYVSNEL